MSGPINNPNLIWDEENQVFRGKFIVGEDVDMTFKVKNDKTIDEGNETFNISIQNIDESGLDSITGKSVNDSSVKEKNVNIIDSSRSAKFLSLVADKNTLNENEILIPSPQQYLGNDQYRSNVNDNTKLTLTATGQDFLTADDGQIEFEVVGSSGNIVASDFNPNNLRGYLTVQNDTTAVGELFVNQDFLEEGEERFRVRIVDNPLIQTDEIVILDTSIPQPVFQSIDIVPVDVMRESEESYKIVSGDFANDSEGWILHEASYSNEYGGSIKMTEIPGSGQSKIGKIVEYDFVEGHTYKFRVKVEYLSHHSLYDAKIGIYLHRPDRFITADGNWDHWPIQHSDYASTELNAYYPNAVITDSVWMEITYVCDSQLASEGRVLMLVGHHGNFETANIGGYEVIDTSINYSVEGESFHVYLNGQNLTNYSYPQTSLFISTTKNDDGSKYITFDNPDGNDNWIEEPFLFSGHIHGSYIPESRFNDDSRILLDTIKILPDDNVNNSNREFTLSFRFYKMVDNFTYESDSLSSEFIVLPDIPVYESFVASPSTVNETDNNVVTLTLSGTNITYEGQQMEFRIVDNSTGSTFEKSWGSLKYKDLSPRAFYGNLTGIDRNTATGTITIVEDNLDENAESFYCYLSSNSNIRTNDVIILDTSAPNVWEITPSSLKVSEGSSLSIDVTLKNLDPLELPTPGTAYWSVLDKPEDFETSSGSFSMQGDFFNSSGQFSVTPKVDSDTTPEDFRVAVRKSPNGNNEVISEPITILAEAIYTVTPRNNQTSVDEGSSITFDVLVENVDTDEYNAIKNNSVSNTHGNYVHQPILGWQINHPNLSGDFNLPTDYYVQLSIDDSSKLSNGTATLSGSFSVSVKNDNLSEPNPETFNVEIFRLPVSYANDVNNWTSKNTSVDITINDTSTSPESYSITPDSYAISEGSILNVSVDVQNINPSDLPTPGKLYWEINHITTESDDFQANSGELDVSGDFYNSNGTFQINVSENFEDYDETFTISIKKSPSSSASVTSPIITITGTEILFDTLTASDTSLNETNNRTTTITLTGTNLNGSYRCKILPANNSNITPSDFYDLSALYVWLDTNGSTIEATGTITVHYDKITEGTETFYVQLDDESQGIKRTADITIDDTSLTPTYSKLFASDYTLNENDNRTTTITLTGTNLGAFDDRYACTIVPVNSNITRSDFSQGVFEISGILGVTLVNQNSTTATGTITIAEDSTIEGTETFYVKLNDESQGIIKTNNITISDITTVTPTFNDLVASDLFLDETSPNNNKTTITLTGTNLSGSYGCTIIPVNQYSDITDSDFTPIGLSVTLNTNGSTIEATGTITIAEDFTTEQTEAFYVKLNDESQGIIKTETITIIDTSKDPVVTPTFNDLFASDYSLDETSSNNRSTTITLEGTNLSGTYGCTIRPANSSDITGADFTSGDLNVTLTSNSAGTQATGTITIAEDSTIEGTETFYVKLNDESQGIKRTENITIGDTSRNPTTYNTLSANPIQLDETDNTTTTITLTGTNLSGSYACTIKPVSAGIEPSDFTSNSLSVTLNTTNGSTTQATGIITIAADSLNEGTETFYVQLDDESQGIKRTVDITIDIPQVVNDSPVVSGIEYINYTLPQPSRQSHPSFDFLSGHVIMKWDLSPNLGDGWALQYSDSSYTRYLDPLLYGNKFSSEFDLGPDPIYWSYSNQNTTSGIKFKHGKSSSTTGQTNSEYGSTIYPANFTIPAKNSVTISQTNLDININPAHLRFNLTPYGFQQGLTSGTSRLYIFALQENSADFDRFNSGNSYPYEVFDTIWTFYSSENPFKNSYGAGLRGFYTTSDYAIFSYSDGWNGARPYIGLFETFRPTPDSELIPSKVRVVDLGHVWQPPGYNGWEY